LIYGSEYNLDFYLNNNLPNGLLTLKGASAEQAQMYRSQMQNQFMDDDSFGNFKKKHFKVPITGYEAVFTQMQMSSKEMEVIEQQKWFTKLVWSVFGVNAEEMGFTEDSNKAISETQGKIAKRKAIKPFIKMFEYIINLQLMPEFGHPEYEFKFIEYDLEEEKAKQDLWEQQIRMGVRTAKQIAIQEMGISEQEYAEAEQEIKEKEQENEYNNDNNDNDWWTKSEMKHKYIKRTGSPGNYEYEYQGDKKEKTSPIKMTEDMWNNSDEEYKVKLIKELGFPTSAPSGFPTEYSKAKTMNDLVKMVGGGKIAQAMLQLNRKLIDLSGGNLKVDWEKKGMYGGENTDEGDLWTKSIKTTPIEKEFIKGLKELENKVLYDVELSQRGLAEIKGFIDYKAITQEALDKYDNFFNTAEYRQILNDALGKEFSKGVEQIEKKLNRNVIVSTQDINTITEFAFNNIKDMNQELVNNLRKQITMGLLNKENMNQIKKRIKEQFVISENRARAILQTETNRIYGTGSYNAAKQSGVEFYKYIDATLDKRTSEICKDLDLRYGSPEQAIPIDDKFKLINGKEELHNPFHVNCRSVTLYVPKDEVKKDLNKQKDMN
jgi:SPP1 gp7 family putative phage head morphogenesis protein